jgi:hypothetical protein
MAVVRKKANRVRLNNMARGGNGVESDLAESYNKYKEYKGTQYTGMKIGRSHKWYYDQGEWRETKVTPDLWEISYAVTKRRAGKAPEGSGVPEGTAYHWFILAHQNVKKLNANDYSTALSGFKYKLAHHRADKSKWSASSKAQRKRLIKLLEDTIAQLKQVPLQLELEYNGVTYKGEATPVQASCSNGICVEFEVTLNEEYIGIIKYRKSGWKMDGAQDEKFVREIGKEISLWYETEES